MTRFGKWIGRSVRSTLKVVSPNAVRTILQESNTSLSALKEVARSNAEKHEIVGKENLAKAAQLAVSAKSSLSKATDINYALAELDSADGKL